MAICFTCSRSVSVLSYGRGTNLLRHDAPDLAAFISSLQHFLVRITLLLLLRKLEPSILLANGRCHDIAYARAIACTEHEVRGKLRTARRTQDVILLLFLLSGEGGEARSSEALRLRARVVALLLGAVQAIRDFSFLVTILAIFNVLPHRTEVGGKVAEVAREPCHSHGRSLAVSGRWLRCTGRRINRGTRLEDGRISRKVGSSRLCNRCRGGGGKCISCKWRGLVGGRSCLQVSDDPLQRRQGVA